MYDEKEYCVLVMLRKYIAQILSCVVPENIHTLTPPPPPPPPWKFSLRGWGVWRTPKFLSCIFSPHSQVITSILLHFYFFPILGHSTSQVGGHGLFMENIHPLNGFNGSFGFRRNTPWLRNQPSVFTGKLHAHVNVWCKVKLSYQLC